MSYVRKPTMAKVQDEADVYYSQYFRYKDNGLYCENVSICDVRRFLEENGAQLSSRFFLYSQTQLEANVISYKNALKDISKKSSLNFALKANMNPTLLEVMRDHGCSLTLVSGFELQLALRMGFQPADMVLNGNGKQDWEVELAVIQGCMLNVDSLFNLEQTARICQKVKKEGRVLIRFNPDLHADVHRHNVTSGSSSKFGIGAGDLNPIIRGLEESQYLRCVGLHCHVGSTITDLQTFRRAAEITMETFRDLYNRGLTDMSYLNLGGGLAIPYTKHTYTTQDESCPNLESDIPTPQQLVDLINDVIAEDDVTLILEPGRSLVGNAGVLISTVLGVKNGPSKSHIVVDGSMTDVIRPALYEAYHHIDLVNKPQSGADRRWYDVVGPVCESGDFLGRDRYLATPEAGSLMATFDVGAYCTSMASNYNMRARPAEVLVKGSNMKIIRQPDSLDSILAPYNVQTDNKTDGGTK